MKIVTAGEMREIDRRTVERHGVSYWQLMENAASRVVQYAREREAAGEGGAVVVLCGKGNNGGDGLGFARLWREATGTAPQAFLLADPTQLKGDAAENYRRLVGAGITAKVVTKESEVVGLREAVTGASLIVDALLGTGLRGEAEGLTAAAIEEINRRGQRTRVIAVDIPSGLHSDGKHEGGAVVRADHTVTFTAPKVGLVADGNGQWVGGIAVAQIGSPWQVIEELSASKWRWLEPMEFRSLPLVRRRDAHKGDFGHALVVAGSRGKAGAAGLAGMGSLRCGAGLTTVATPESSLDVVAGYAPEYMTEALAETDMGTVSLRCLEYGRFDGLMKGKSALAIGPGLSTLPETQEFVRTVVGRCPVPMVLDADGLNAYAGRAEELRNRQSPWLAVTPHPGEMARLCGKSVEELQRRRAEVALECAARWNAHVILKGYHTLIATPGGELFVNPAGTPAMASGGTGDVLTGVLAGVTAQFGTADWGRVLGFGVYLHGCAGQVAESQGASLASDLARAVQRVRSELSQRPRDESTLAFC
jgi:NAD(P)H-hydrate epimerase